MKMTQEHYQTLKGKIAPFTYTIAGHIERVKSEGNYKDLETRILFDIFHAAKIWKDYSYQEFDYNDAHILTAMRSIAKELDIKIS